MLLILLVMGQRPCLDGAGCPPGSRGGPGLLLVLLLLVMPVLEWGRAALPANGTATVASATAAAGACPGIGAGCPSANGDRALLLLLLLLLLVPVLEWGRAAPSPMGLATVASDAVAADDARPGMGAGCPPADEDGHRCF